MPEHGRKFGSRHPRPEQHDWPPAVHVWPCDTHVEALQVPVCWPAGMLQVEPEQQSALAPHVPPSGEHVTAGPHTPPLHCCEQHCTEN